MKYAWALIAFLLAIGLLASAQSVAIQPGPETDAWGDPVDGIQLRLVVWKNLPAYIAPSLPGEFPRLEMQIRNMGTDTATINCHIGQMSEIEIDGIWYEPGGFAETGDCALPPALVPGYQSGPILLAFQLLLVDGKAVVFDGFHVGPGKHVVQVRTSSKSFGVEDSAHQVIALGSSKVTIEIPDLSPEAETQALIEQASAGGIKGLSAARRLAEKYPEAALAAIESVVRATPDAGTRSQYVDLAGNLPGDAPVAFLRSQLAPDAGLVSQVSAAKALFARGEPDWLPALVGAWQNIVQPRVPKGMSGQTAVANLIMFLVKTGNTEAIDALGNNAQTPVDVRLAVVKAFLPVGMNGEISAKGPWIVSTLVRPEMTSLPQGEAGSAIERVLSAALDDEEQRVGLKSSYENVPYEDPRVCDIAALVVSTRWPQQYRFTLAASLADRDAQIAVIRRGWPIH